MVQNRSKNTPPIQIRYLADHEEAIPVVAGWIFREWSFLYRGKSRRYVEGFLGLRLHKKKLPLTLVAFAEDKPVGTVSLKEYDIEGRQDLPDWVTSLYVVPKWRGRGVGSCLMKAAAEKAGRLGIRRLFLFTADSSLAVRFYSHLGWKILENEVYLSYPIIIMEKDLEAFEKEADAGTDDSRVITEISKR